MKQTLWFFLLATLLWAILMGVQARHFDQSLHTKSIIESPIADLELADTQTKFDSILNWGNRFKNMRVVQANTYMDFVFIVLYCPALALMFWVCSVNKRFALSFALLMVAVGIFDVLENVRILGQITALRTTSVAPLPNGPSLVKWTLFSIALWLLGSLLLSRGPGRLAKAMAIFVLIAAAICTTGLFHNEIIGLSVICLFPALLLAAWIWRPAA